TWLCRVPRRGGRQHPWPAPAPEAGRSRCENLLDLARSPPQTAGAGPSRRQKLANQLPEPLRGPEVKTLNTITKDAHRLSVAPMMDWTDRHCRAFRRSLSKRAELYTEMVTAPA